MVFNGHVLSPSVFPILRVNLRPPQGGKSPSSNTYSRSRPQGEMTFSLVSFWIGFISCFLVSAECKISKAEIGLLAQRKEARKTTNQWLFLQVSGGTEGNLVVHTLSNQVPQLKKTESQSQVPAPRKLYFYFALCPLPCLMRIFYYLKHTHRANFHRSKTNHH